MVLGPNLAGAKIIIGSLEMDKAQVFMEPLGRENEGELTAVPALLRPPERSIKKGGTIW